MIYGFLRIVIPVAIRIFYKNFYIRNRQNLPYNVPVIIASNHPNAVVDACAITAFTRQWSYYLARGDVFKNNFAGWFLKQLGIIPIYRLQEGAENLHLNQITFRKCFELLEKKKTILIFSEGICIQERRLRKLKKGTARIAFSAEEISNWKLGLIVVPVGINYSNPKKFRSTLVVNYGKPIEMNSFRDAYLKDKAAAINDFTKYLESKLSELVIHINDKENDLLVADIETVYKKQLIKSKGKNSASNEEDFIATQEIVKTVNHFNQTCPEKINIFRNKIRNYLSHIEALKTHDWVVKKFSDHPTYLPLIPLRFSLLLLGFPIHLFGLINNYFPYKIAYTSANKIAKSVEFYATVTIVLALLLYLIFYSLQILAVALIFHNWWIFAAYTFLLPASGWFALHYYFFAKKTLGVFRFYLLKKNNPVTAEKMIVLRNEIIEELVSERKSMLLC